MFRPPPDYPWRCSKNKYEKQFRRKAPQWTLTLDRSSGRALFLACCRIGFKLHPEVLTLGELFSAAVVHPGRLAQDGTAWSEEEGGSDRPQPRVILGSKQLLQLHNPSTILGMKFFKRLLNSCTSTHSPHFIRCDAPAAAALSHLALSLSSFLCV
jgi:hypothetical protein